MTKSVRVIIAYDGSPSADAALDDLKLAGLPASIEAKVISVGELWMAAPAAAGSDTSFMERLPFSLKEAQTLAQRAAERLRTAFPAWEIEEEAQVGAAAAEIIERADIWQPALIIVGCHGKSNFGKLILGSISHKIAAEARCSVRIARAHKRLAGAPVRILIGIDGSYCADVAIDNLAMRSWPAGSEARLVTAINTDSVAQVSYAHGLQQSALNELARTGLKVTSAITAGDPRQVLLDEAEAFVADTIFLGAKGANTYKRFLLGSTALAVATRAHCSVEIIRPLAEY